MFETGQIVYSKRGRDKGLPFVITGIDGEYLFLADGKVRTLEKPKKKKTMHVQRVDRIIGEIKYKIDNRLYMNDAEIRKALEEYKK